MLELVVVSPSVKIPATSCGVNGMFRQNVDEVSVPDARSTALQITRVAMATGVAAMGT